MSYNGLYGARLTQDMTTKWKALLQEKRWISVENHFRTEIGP